MQTQNLNISNGFKNGYQKNNNQIFLLGFLRLFIQIISQIHSQSVHVVILTSSQSVPYVILNCTCSGHKMNIRYPENRLRKIAGNNRLLYKFEIFLGRPPPCL